MCYEFYLSLCIFFFFKSTAWNASPLHRLSTKTIPCNKESFHDWVRFSELCFLINKGYREPWHDQDINKHQKTPSLGHPGRFWFSVWLIKRHEVNSDNFISLHLSLCFVKKPKKHLKSLNQYCKGMAIRMQLVFKVTLCKIRFKILRCIDHRFWT